jgi:hypothetical protein
LLNGNGASHLPYGEGFPIFTPAMSALTSQIIALESELTSWANHPCHCSVCRVRAADARVALAHLSPLGARLVELARSQPLVTTEFKELEEEFRRGEIKRMNEVLAVLKLLRCEVAPSLLRRQDNKSVNISEVEIQSLPSLADAQAVRPKLDGYRAANRRGRVVRGDREPRIPGSYWIK